MGLLSKASELSNTSSLAFSNFIISHNIRTFASFELKDKFYIITNSLGLDGETLLSSESSKDFWEGVCPEENKIYKFMNDNKSLNPMLQFFSFELLEQIDFISLYKHNNHIYMICDQDFNDQIISDLDDIDFQSDYIDLDKINHNLSINKQKLLMFNIDFSEAISNFLSDKAKDLERKELLENILYDSLVNYFSCYFAKAATKKSESNSIKVIINIDNVIQVDHLVAHIIYYFKNIIGQNAQSILFNFIGEADSQTKVKDFFQVD